MTLHRQTNVFTVWQPIQKKALFLQPYQIQFIFIQIFLSRKSVPGDCQFCLKANLKRLGKLHLTIYQIMCIGVTPS